MYPGKDHCTHPAPAAAAPGAAPAGAPGAPAPAAFGSLCK